MKPAPGYIYEKLAKRAVGTYRFFFGRQCIIVKGSDFDLFKEYFDEVPNILNNKINYRTRNTFKHIHAFRSGSLVQLHYDFANPRVSPWMAVPHLIIDVIPFFAYGLLTLQDPYEIGFDRPR